MRRNGKRRLFCNCIQDTIVLVCKIEIGGRCKSKHDYSRQSTTADQPEILGLYHEKYITCETEKVWGKELIYDLKTAEITPEGIAYVCNNSLIEKAKEFLKDIKEITPFI